MGKSGGSLQSRMNMLVLCPPFHEPEGATKSGEVILLLDVYLKYWRIIRREREYTIDVIIEEKILQM